MNGSPINSGWWRTVGATFIGGVALWALVKAVDLNDTMNVHLSKPHPEAVVDQINNLDSKHESQWVTFTNMQNRNADRYADLAAAIAVLCNAANVRCPERRAEWDDSE